VGADQYAEGTFFTLGEPHEVVDPVNAGTDAGRERGPGGGSEGIGGGEKLGPDALLHAPPQKGEVPVTQERVQHGEGHRIEAEEQRSVHFRSSLSQ
jgi:hypothetical protein